MAWYHGAMKYQTGLILGRFQPIHRGHVYLMQQALEQCASIVIVVGSTNVSDDKNPFSFEQRKNMITKAVAKFNLSKRVKGIVAVPDNPSDEAWMKSIEEGVGEFDVVFGNNEWPNKIFEAAGYSVVRVPYLNRERYEGTSIRKSLDLRVDLSSQLEKYLE